MYFRFGSALALVIVVSMAGVAIEKESLVVRRALSRQRYRQEALRELYGRLRLQTAQLGAPQRLFEAVDRQRMEVAQSDGRADATPATGKASPHLPLLSWPRHAEPDR